MEKEVDGRSGLFVVMPLGLFGFVDRETGLKICQNCSAEHWNRIWYELGAYPATLCLSTRVQKGGDSVERRSELRNVIGPPYDNKQYLREFVDEHPWETIT